MNINNFFELSEGYWLCQKTFYNLVKQEYKSSNNKVLIQEGKITKDISETIEQHKIKVRKTLYSFRFNWENKTDISSLILVNTDSLYEGEIYKINNNGSISKNIFYINNKKLTIESKVKNLLIEETIFFYKPNLKISISVVKNNHNRILISFTSEIKIQKF
nr:chromophore lyase cpcS/cpeS [Boldiaceae sp.]